MFERFSGKSVGCNLNKENKFSKLLCGGEFFLFVSPCISYKSTIERVNKQKFSFI